MVAFNFDKGGRIVYPAFWVQTHKNETRGSDKQEDDGLRMGVGSSGHCPSDLRVGATISATTPDRGISCLFEELQPGSSCLTFWP